MSNTEITAEDAVGQLTGYDELAIAKHFGEEIYVLAETKPVTMLRALVFVQHRSAGKSDADAKKLALELPLRELQTWFAEDDAADDLDPDNPTSESGKGDVPSIARLSG